MYEDLSELCIREHLTPNAIATATKGMLQQGRVVNSYAPIAATPGTDEIYSKIYTPNCLYVAVVEMPKSRLDGLC